MIFLRSVALETEKYWTGPSRAGDLARDDRQALVDLSSVSITLALGKQAARQVMSGRMPLWNHYEGFGAPLLGEMQSAALFPPTWLMALRAGQPIAFASLQIIAGVGAYLFFRVFGLGIAAALTGALVFEVNGVMAWLRNAIANPVAFLPWLLLYLECTRSSSLLESSALQLRNRVFNIAWGTVAAALAIYAGFPEEVYLYSFLLGMWAVFRSVGLSRQQLVRFGSDIAIMSFASLILCSPALVTFLDYLQEGELFRHSGQGFSGIWLHPS